MCMCYVRVVLAVYCEFSSRDQRKKNTSTHARHVRTRFVAEIDWAAQRLKSRLGSLKSCALALFGSQHECLSEVRLGSARRMRPQRMRKKNSGAWGGVSECSICATLESAAHAQKKTLLKCRKNSGQDMEREIERGSPSITARKTLVCFRKKNPIEKLKLSLLTFYAR